MSYANDLIICSSPIKQYGDYFISASTIENSHFLKVLKFNPSVEGSFEEIAVTQLTDRITSIGWSKFGSDSEKEYMGLLMAGHADGKLSIWSILQLIENSDTGMNTGMIKSVKGIHHSKVTSIQYNVKPQIVATASNELVIVQIIEEQNGGYNITIALKCENDHDKNEISSVSWNDKVPHILSVASVSGVVYIWDMKKNKVYLKIRDQQMQEDRTNLTTFAVWAADGTQIIIAYDDPEYPFLTQYHMSQTNAPYAEYHGGHNKSIYQLTKNPNDSNYMLSVGQDNAITCWSIRSQKIIQTVHLKEGVKQALWSPRLTDVVILVTEHNTLDVKQINFSNDPSVYLDDNEELPKWMVKRSNVSFGWGGRFVSYNEKFGVGIHQLTNSNPNVARITDFINKTESNQSDKLAFIEEKIAALERETHTSNEKNILLLWVALKSIASNSFAELQKYFGFDKENIISDAQANIGKVVKAGPTRRVINNKEPTKNKTKKQENAIDIFNNLETKNEINTSKIVKEEPEKPMTVKEEFNRNMDWNQLDERHIKSSLMFGDLELAMENAFKADRDAEALLIASSDFELFSKARNKFLSKSKDPYIKNVFSSIINKNFNQLLDYNKKDWKEYILYAKTYLDAEGFKVFACSLGDKLVISGDVGSALVCYVLGGDCVKVVDKLYSGYINAHSDDKDGLLVNLVEQVVTVHYVLGDSMNNDITNGILKDYCKLLFEYGLYKEACTYLVKLTGNANDIETRNLFDRIYHANEDVIGKMFKKPITPYKEVFLKAVKEQRVQPIKEQLGHTKKDKKDSGVQPVIGPNSAYGLGHVHGPNQNQSHSQTFSSPQQKEQSQSQPQPQPVIIPSNQAKISKPPTIIKPPLKTGTDTINHPHEKVQQDFTNNDTRSVNSGSHTIKQGVKPPIKAPLVQPPVISTSGGKLPPKKAEVVEQSSGLIQTQSNPSNVQTQSIGGGLDEESATISSAFERYQELYNSVYKDDTRQKDFSSKLESLNKKLEGNELKPNLKKQILLFINEFDSGKTSKDLKPLVSKIQANQWDQNKTWMPALDKLIAMPRK